MPPLKPTSPTQTQAMTSPSEDRLLLSHHAAASATLRYSAVHPVQMAGWLSKEGRSLRTRRMRYVTLTSHVLSSHKTPHSPPSWHISIADAIIDRGLLAREIKISLPHRVFTFVAPTAHLFDAWIVALRRASLVSSRVDDYYRIGRLIGEGMNGQVRLAQDIITHANVAIKMVPRLGRENETQFLAREVQIILSVSHPNIVRTIDVFVRSRRIHFVMEYLPGGELFDFIADNNHFTELHAAHVMIDLLNALQYLHSNSIAHRDVKLENLLCANTTWPLHVKLADFGFANYVNPDHEPMLSSFVGTPYYIAPEMLRGDAHGRPVDIWASGVVLYILLSGKFPFGGNSEVEYYQRVLTKEAYFPAEEWAKISELAKHFIRGMLCKDPQKRLTAQQCLDHPWLQKAKSLNNAHNPHLFTQHSQPCATTPDLEAPGAFRNVREKRGKRRYLRMLNHSLTSPTENMVHASREAAQTTAHERCQSANTNTSRNARAKVYTDGDESSSVNRRPSMHILRRLLSSGRSSLDQDARFPSFRGNTDEQADEASATPRKTMSLFAKDGPLRRSFHRVVENRQSEEGGINFANSQSQRLPPKILRERQRQQRNTDASRRTLGIFTGRKVLHFANRNNEYHSSPRLQTHITTPLHHKTTQQRRQRNILQAHLSNRDDISAPHLEQHDRLPSDHSSMALGNNGFVPFHQVLEPTSPVPSTDRVDAVRRTVSADVSSTDHAFTDMVKMDLLTQRGLGEIGKASRLKLVSRNHATACRM